MSLLPTLRLAFAVWPLFTALHTAIVAGPLYLLAVVLWIVDRRRAERERMAI